MRAQDFVSLAGVVSQLHFSVRTEVICLSNLDVSSTQEVRWGIYCLIRVTVLRIHMLGLDVFNFNRDNEARNFTTMFVKILIAWLL